jgi:hypothetical protein
VAAEYRQVNLSLLVAIDGCRVLAVSLGDGRVGQVWSVVLNALASNPQANPQVHQLRAEELVA